jgi:diacylglycerol kinase (ATP)
MPRRFLVSLTHALRGLRFAVHEERNIRLQLCASLAIIALGCWLSFSGLEWVAVALSIVLTAELINTACEDLLDRLVPHHDPVVGKVKDILAAAVVVSSLAAVVVGSLIVWSAWLR